MGQGHGAHRPREVDQIAYLAGTYFHQDHDLEAREPLGVVRNFLDHADEEGVSALRRQVVRLLADPRGDAALADAWLATGGAEYDPRDDGVPLRVWFESIVALVDGRTP